MSLASCVMVQMSLSVWWYSRGYWHLTATTYGYTHTY
jgi:hypothetical protein